MEPAFKHILVATDGSPRADAAIALALRLQAGARITALLVVHDYGLPEYLHAALHQRPDAQSLREEALADGRRTLEAALARVPGAERLDDRRVVLSDQAASRAIVTLAQREGCDLIVMSSHGLGGRLAGLLGSQSQAVLSLATMPVLVAR